jgi:hypothetical protein
MYFLYRNSAKRFYVVSTSATQPRLPSEENDSRFHKEWKYKFSRLLASEVPFSWNVQEKLLDDKDHNNVQGNSVYITSRV